MRIADARSARHIDEYDEDAKQDRSARHIDEYDEDAKQDRSARHIDEYDEDAKQDRSERHIEEYDEDAKDTAASNYAGRRIQGALELRNIRQTAQTFPPNTFIRRPDLTEHEIENNQIVSQERRRLADEIRAATPPEIVLQRAQDRHLANLQRNQRRREANSARGNVLRGIARKWTIDEFDESTVEEHYCGPMDQVCPHCGALYWKLEETCRSGIYLKQH